ncbi:HAMP domain-containing histidine kinase [Solihabitans fulvus]|uniref:Sensor-like histidine kinase SenX3 n=1 Tax=Solihabitans fulvus TaxID=1892852 RepID=A0A5B2XUI8_9PSEU|nr:HAMP domain-containing sensor histidine kinase [Solihabitans fulvus]KAA2267166.1 HAMP domain-containing histidine kinase [Solihabitans fulvus]
MNGSSADRLRRLRWVLTALFTGMNTVGLVILAWFVLSRDDAQGIAQIDVQLDRVTSAISRQVSFDGTINFSMVNSDELNSSCPQFAIMPGGAPEFQAHLSTKTCVPMDTGVLNGLAADAVRTHGIVTGYQTGSNGDLVRVRVEPLLNPANGRYIGAVVAVADTRPVQEAHTRLVLLVVGGCVLLVAALGVAGHLLSGRSIQPAAAALQQQEVLLAETAHDLRTPVAALRALAETALDNPTQRADLLPRTVRLAVRMGSIIDDLLVRARLAAGVEQLTIQPVWLDQLVTGVVEDTHAEGAQVTVTAAPTKVDADPTLLQRAVGNLLNNAVRYGRRPGEEAIVHITVAGGTVTVADHGPGIDAAAVEDAFDRFSSTGGSSGLGLSIVRWVAQAHGGTLSVYNADEGGAIFELTLPVSAA